MRVPAAAFAAEWADAEALKAKGGQDRYGRRFTVDQHCEPPFHAVKVTGALFHTQGGLAIDAACRVKGKDGTVISNLFAAGGAAAGVSGPTAAGYLSGNGLLAATVLGHLAGKVAAAQLAHGGQASQKISRHAVPGLSSSVTSVFETSTRIRRP